MAEPKPSLWQEGIRFLKFGITGVMNTAIDFLVFTVVLYLGGNPYFSQVLSYSAGMLNSYLLNRSWTFQSKERIWSGQMLRFLVANLSLLVASLGVIWLVHGQIGAPELLAKLFATGMTMVVGFLVNRFWVFKQ